MNLKKLLSFLPASAGLILLFLLHFALLLAAVLLVSVGLLAAPLGGLYMAGIIKVVSDLTPEAMAMAGLCLIFFGLSLCFMESAVAPASIRLLHRFSGWLKDEPYRRVWRRTRKKAWLWLLPVFTVIAGASCVLIQHQAVNDGFTGTVCREEHSFRKARYITIETTNMDFDIKPCEGENIIIEYVTDSPMIIEQEDENYLKLRQDDSFTLSLFSADQFSYKMTVWLPLYDYRELYFSSSSGSIYLECTLGEYTELSTRSGNIDIYDAWEKLTAQTFSGDIACNYLAFSNAGTFTTESGDVNITLPEFSGVTLEFETVCGSVFSNMFPDTKEKPLYRSTVLERPAGLSRHLYITTYSGNAVITGV